MTRSSDLTRETPQDSLPPASEVQTAGIVGPRVGDPWPPLKPEDVSWPDTNWGAFRFDSARDGARISRSLTVKLHFKTGLFVVALLAVIASYAMRQHDSALLKAIVSAVGTDSRNGSASESPP